MCFVYYRDNGSETGRWVKLDDGDVTECAMHDDEEMKAQCFGGEYTGEVSLSIAASDIYQNAQCLLYYYFFTVCLCVSHVINYYIYFLRENDNSVDKVFRRMTPSILSYVAMASCAANRFSKFYFIVTTYCK